LANGSKWIVAVGSDNDAARASRRRSFACSSFFKYGRESAIVTARRFRQSVTNFQTRSNSAARRFAGTSAK
jgi:hypothetical protein